MGAAVTSRSAPAPSKRPASRSSSAAPPAPCAPAGLRERYFPVVYVEPLRGNEKAVGFDLYSNAARHAAIDAAIETRMPQSTARITLVQETGDQYGFLVFYPVYQEASAGADSLRGMVLGVFRIGDVISQGATDRIEDGNMTLAIWDLAADASDSLLFPEVRPPGARRETVSTLAQPERRGPSLEGRGHGHACLHGQ